MKKNTVTAVVAVVVALILIVGITVYWSTSRRSASANGTPPAGQQAQQQTPSTPGHSGPNASGSAPNKSASGANQGAAGSTDAIAIAKRYCNADHKTDTSAITKAGGLVTIFEHEAAVSDAYGCAGDYLDHGGNVNGVDPKTQLTPLLFAVKRNDPKMVHFLLDHGADPEKRGGPKKIKPYGYAVFEALHNRSTNYNQVISILDSAVGSGNSSK